MHVHHSFDTSGTTINIFEPVIASSFGVHGFRKNQIPECVHQKKTLLFLLDERYHTLRICCTFGGDDIALLGIVFDIECWIFFIFFFLSFSLERRASRMGQQVCIYVLLKNSELFDFGNLNFH